MDKEASLLPPITHRCTCDLRNFRLPSTAPPGSLHTTCPTKQSSGTRTSGKLSFPRKFAEFSLGLESLAHYFTIAVFIRRGTELFQG